MAATRFALYFAPAPDHPLWAAGCQWLQRDAALPEDAPPKPLRPRVAAPRRYGFHATFKAPFRLRAGVDEAGLLHAVRAFAARRPAFAMPPLEVATLAEFLALRPIHPVDAHHPLRRLADACVEHFEPLRAPLTAEELARREPAGMSARQRELFERFGYPYVFEEWRFHMTLTDSLGDADAADREALAGWARAHFAAALARPLRCEQLAIFVQGRADQDFTLAHRVPLCLV
jgi:putative phosphonate metabolism protein